MKNSFFETNKHGFQENKHYFFLKKKHVFSIFFVYCPESLTESLQQTFNKLSGQ